MIKRAHALLLIFISIQILVQAQINPTKTILLKAENLIDTRNGRKLTGQAILIENDRIKEIGPVKILVSRTPNNTQIIDLGNVTLLPGLIDCHTHLTFNPELLSYLRLSVSGPREALYGVKNGQKTLEAGFTSVRNLGATSYADVALRDAINTNDIMGPRMIVSGPGVGITGGHCDENLLSPKFSYHPEGVADGVSAVMQKTREIIKYGADCIKICATGGVLSINSTPGQEQFSDEELRAIVTEAHRLNRKVAAHAHGASGIKQAILAGVDSIEHGSLINDEGIKLMKEKGTYLVPTLYLGDWALDNYQQLRLPSFVLEKMREVIPASRENLAHAFKAGVRVAFGTDAAVYPHGLNAREFNLMVKLGLTPMQAIQSATVNAADLLGWNSRIGALEAGLFADIIAVKGDPLSDITELERVMFVMKGGQVIKNNLATTTSPALH